ncbi:hypothetical protein PUN28_017315 [Cardiocondyla obscurior]|uniref:Uncharacterized protein n=1 Tax=Cardiocondyla obscurior TaxID=286306 RepID=A0AAW2EL93_9HYME
MKRRFSSMIAGIIGITPGRIAPHAVTNSQYRENRALTPSPGRSFPESLKAAASRIPASRKSQLSPKSN